MLVVTDCLYDGYDAISLMIIRFLFSIPLGSSTCKHVYYLSVLKEDYIVYRCGFKAPSEAALFLAKKRETNWHEMLEMPHNIRWLRFRTHSSVLQKKVFKP